MTANLCSLLKILHRNEVSNKRIGNEHRIGASIFFHRNEASNFSHKNEVSNKRIGNECRNEASVFYMKMKFQLSYMEMKPMKPQTSFKQENRKCLRRPVDVMKPQSM